MKIIITALILISTQAAHAEFTNGYVRQNGTYVQGYNHTPKDSTISNNYSTVGNTNPYTGQAGTVKPSPTYFSPNQQPRF